MKEMMKIQPASDFAAQQAAKQQSVEPTKEELREEIRLAEQDFRDLQERYDLFAMRYYASRYQPWFEQASDYYRKGIRKRYFRLLRLERNLAALNSPAPIGRPQ